MLTLCLDTSHRYMGIALLKDEELLDQTIMDCFKQQAELLISKVDDLLTRNSLSSKDIDEICVAKGPGSYTGVRIAMTVAKTLGAVANLLVYTVSTLRLYSGGNKGLVLMDARSNRAYVGYYLNDYAWEGIMTLDEIKERLCFLDVHVYGDCDLLDMNENYIDIGTCFLNTREYWEKVENIHSLEPEYFKTEEGYKKQA